MACVAFVRNYDAQGVVGTYPLVKGFCWYVIIFMGNSLSQAVEIRSLIADVTFPPSLCMQETFGQQSLSMLFFLTFGTSFLLKQIGFWGRKFLGFGWGWGAKIMIWNKKNMCFLSKVGMYRILPSILGGCPSILNSQSCHLSWKNWSYPSDPLANQELTPKKTAGISLETNAKYSWSYFRSEIRINMGWIYAPYNNRGE